ncbi:MAG: ABC transporter [Spirochaetaceae bacterium 4572_7]|nr:MAG: ABC transporter [Spirochaetaceae bacterium 4572_7]
MDNYLELINLTKVYHNKKHINITAVDDINLSIKKGEFVTLLGPSGCGKTTILRIIAGLENQTYGDIILENNIINNQPSSKRGMAMVFQNYALFPHLNIFDNIAYGLKIRKKSQDIIKNDVAMVCQVVNLVGLEERFPNELSGGQQQRVALARAIILKPKMLLFDEPLSNLDVKLRLQTRTEIKRIQQMLGITVLYVTHDQSEALSMSDKVVVMNKGKIIQIGKPEYIYDNPNSLFVSDFIGNTNFINVLVEDIDNRRVTVKLQNRLLIVENVENFDSFKIGEEVNFSIKPEAIFFSNDPADFSGRMDISFFLGNSTEFRIYFDGSFITILRSNSDEHQPEYMHGDKVFFKFTKQQFNIFKK